MSIKGKRLNPRGMESFESIHASWSRVSWWFWILLLVSLPVTSFPLIAKIFGGSTVNPVAAIFTAILVVIWLIPFLLKGGRISPGFYYLFAFLLVAAVASFLGNLRGVFPWKGKTVVDREMYAWITLLVGCAFYLITTTIIDSQDKLKASLKWINTGAALMIVWTLCQGFYVVFAESQYPGWMQRTHVLISIRSLVHGRVTGFAYEPSWLAHQLNVLYFPLWISAVFYLRNGKGKVTRFLTPAVVLLIVGVIVLFLSGSRIGLLGFIAMTGFLSLLVSAKITQKICSGILQRLRIRRVRLIRYFSWGLSVLIWVLIMMGFLVLAYNMILLASRIDPRLERIFSVDWLSMIPTRVADIGASVGLLLSARFANVLLFGERSVYWEAAMQIFSDHPVFGVGLGNAGFYFRETMPAFSWSLPEVVNVMRDGASNFPNPKNLWLRLLSETGIVGFTFFINWMAWHLKSAVQMISGTDSHYRSIGMAGILGLIAMLVEGFSLDTFGLPYYWILFGIVAASIRLSQQSKAEAALDQC